MPFQRVSVIVREARPSTGRVVVYHAPRYARGRARGHEVSSDAATLASNGPEVPVPLVAPFCTAFLVEGMLGAAHWTAADVPPPKMRPTDDKKPQGPTGGRTSSLGHAAKSASTLGVGGSTRCRSTSSSARSQAIGLRGSRPVREIVVTKLEAPPVTRSEAVIHTAGTP